MVSFRQESEVYRDELSALRADHGIVGNPNSYCYPTPRMTIPFAIDFMEKLYPDGWSGIMKENHEKVVRASDLISG